jgi:hypothetical protein
MGTRLKLMKIDEAGFQKMDLLISFVALIGIRAVLFSALLSGAAPSLRTFLLAPMHI